MEWKDLGKERLFWVLNASSWLSSFLALEEPFVERMSMRQVEESKALCYEPLVGEDLLDGRS